MKWSDRLIWATALAFTATIVFSACGQNPKTKKQVSTPTAGTHAAAGTTITPTATGTSFEASSFHITNASWSIGSAGVFKQSFAISVDGVTSEPVNISLSMDTNDGFSDGVDFVDVKAGQTQALMLGSQGLLSEQNIQISSIARCADLKSLDTVCDQMYSTTYIWTLNSDKSMKNIFQFGIYHDGASANIVTKSLNQTVDFDSIIKELSSFVQIF